MADNIFTRALGRAVTDQGSTQALASLLRVPERTLLRWMHGAAMMPVMAFTRLIEILIDHEKRSPAEAGDADTASGAALSFRVGKESAQCLHCGAASFVSSTPGLKLRYGTRLICASCREDVVHATLLVALASRYARQMRRPPAPPRTTARPRREDGAPRSS